jgi:hypothetical protein
MPTSGMVRRVAFIRPEVSEERIASILRVTRIGELETTSVLIRVTRRNIPEDAFFNLKFILK